MRRIVLLAVIALCACEPNRAGIEEVFLEQETAASYLAYEQLREQAYRTLRRQGPEAAHSAFMQAYRLQGAGAQSWELLPVIARLEMARHQPVMASRMVAAARLSHRLSRGDLHCATDGTFLTQANGVRPYGDAEVGSAAMVAMNMCREPAPPYPKREADKGDALFERKLAAMEALLPPGAGGSAPNAP